MAIFTQYKCDGCGTEKREANHWFALWVFGGQLKIEPLEALQRRADVAMNVEILCGHQCVTKKVSEWMGAKR